MYENVAERSESANRIANVRGLIRNFYDNVKALTVLRDAYVLVETPLATYTANEEYIHDSIDNFYASDEVADLFAAIAEAEAVIADWEVDHAEALGL